ncbi:MULTISPECIES: DNA polymerase III subunit delta [Microbacterium]|uniref:DNA polymerase III subunit delta n=1 Tax=Microbacterium TaxID=33882 RepID=UPI00217E2C09|nr:MULTISPECIES: DNA polymerase III subunit delta [Microbacterium]UWF76674.1 DNA polymerase III subunit delta [Microbacterium neungamense]WCM54824.1 DNA polymerase III subunit delta [Microbacterium sp. EF45047]
MPAARTSARGSGARGSAAKASIPQVSWREPRPAPIVLVSGPEEICAERAIAGIRDYLRAEDPALEVSDVRADDYAPGTLLALTSPSLFGEPRLVRVAGVEKCTDAFIQEAVAYLEHPQEGATVILRHTGASVRGKKLLDAVRAGTGGGIEIACPAIKRDGDRVDFAAGEFKAAGKRIAPAALRALVSAFGEDITELAAACQQLIGDVEGDITEDVVTKYYGGRVEVSAFVVADTAIAGRYGEALMALRHALASGADPVPMVAAFAMKLRTMARVAGNREPSRQLAQRLGMKDWQVDRARRDLMGWNERSLGMAIQATARADAEVKGAARDPIFALERMVTVIATRQPFGSEG